MIARHKSVRWFLTAAFSCGLLLIAAAHVNAGVIDSSHLPMFTMQAEGAPDAWTWTPPVSAFTPAPNGGYQLRNTYQQTGVCDGRADVKVDTLQFDPDPFVLNNILVTNTTTSTQIFSVTVGLPTSFGAPNNISGTMTTSVIDGNASGNATIASVPGQPVYKGQIDFATVATMQNDPFALATAGSTASSASFGPTLNAVPVTSNIGIQLTFSLTAGDSASILSRFDVNPVPEPSSAACIATMFVLTGTVSRRHRRAR
jgi:hypothetical protein